MRLTARTFATAANALLLHGIVTALWTGSPSPTREATAAGAPQLAWAPPAWFPEEAPSHLWALKELDQPAVRADGPRVRARSAIVADLDRGEVLFEHQADDLWPVASLTKMVSGLALASTDPDLNAEWCSTPEFWPNRPGGRSRFETKRCYTGWEYLGGAMVQSDNRGAMALPVVSGLRYEAFIERMHEVSRELGMHEATWADPSGLDDENMASARDMLKAVVAVSAHPDLSLVASARSWRIGEDAPRELVTTNKLVERYETLAAKTGYTDTARYCFATVVRTREGRTLAVAVLGAPSTATRFADTEALLRWASRIDG